eukprot:9143354-Pyramimonas_sp.AAC.1
MQVPIAGAAARSAPAEKLEAIAARAFRPRPHKGAPPVAKVAANMEEAVQLARGVVGREGVVCVTGSLHAAASALSLLGPHKQCAEGVGS